MEVLVMYLFCAIFGVLLFYGDPLHEKTAVSLNPMKLFGLK